MAAASVPRGRVARRAASPSRRRNQTATPRKRASVGVAGIGRSPRRSGQARVVELGIAARAQLTRRNLFAGSLLALVGLVNVYSGLWVSGLSYELTHAHEVQGRLERELQDLKVAFATATAPDRLEAMADGRLAYRLKPVGEMGRPMS